MITITISVKNPMIAVIINPNPNCSESAVCIAEVNINPMPKMIPKSSDVIEIIQIVISDADAKLTSSSALSH